MVRTKDTGPLQYELYFNSDNTECLAFERYRDSQVLVKPRRKWYEFCCMVTRKRRPSQCPSTASTSLTPASGGSSRSRNDIWVSQQRTRFAFGTIATPRTRRCFTPRLFPIHPSARCTAHRETFRPGRKGMC